jgi:hypothetical protein
MPAIRLRYPAVWTVLTAAVVLATWPQAIQLTRLGDFGDPLLNSWTLAWVAHAIASSPTTLFDANIFHPEGGALAYSETLLLPALIVAPLSWIGVSPIAVHNLLLLGALVLSGATMFALVRHQTGHDGAAVVSALVFALYPYRIEEFPKVQLQIVWWWPLALLALERGLRASSIRHAIAFAVCAAAQIYSCIYYGIYGGVFTAVVMLVFLSVEGAWRRAAAWRWSAIATGGAIAIAAPLALPYYKASSVVGGRALGEIAPYSAEPGDYLRAHPENALYGDDRHPGRAERRLFPGYTTPLLAAIGLVPPIGTATLAYLGAGAVAFDLSLGTNGVGYAALHERLTPFQALRVPARFGMFVGLALAVLAGAGVARLCRARSAAIQWAIVIGISALVVAESRMRPQDLRPLPDAAPAVYAWLAAQPAGVVCEYPVGPLEGRAGPQDATYMYYSTRHWRPLVNGFSGFLPPSYHELLARLDAFPSREAIAYLRERGVSYLLVHSVFYIQGDFSADVAALRADDQLEWAGSFPWAGGGRTEVFRIRR